MTMMVCVHRHNHREDPISIIAAIKCSAGDGGLVYLNLFTGCHLSMPRRAPISSTASSL